MKKTLSILLLMALLLTTACSSKSEESKKIVIAEQFGLAYAPIQIMKDKGFLADALVDYKIEWLQLANTAAIREAALAGNLDVGFLGIPPFLMAYENGMEWGVFSGLSSAPLGLVTNDPSIDRLEAIRKSDRIIVPQPGSIQHILLSMAAEKTFGDASYFDEQLITMKHPDGMTSMLSSDVTMLHFTSPPFLFEELKNDKLSLVIDGDTCFGDDFTFIVGMATARFKEDEKAYLALQKSLEEAINFMNEHPEESIDILEKYYDYDRELLKSYVYQEGISYSKDIKGLESFISFMKANDLLKSDIKVEDVLWQE